MARSVTPIKIDTINITAGTQYRVEMDESVITDMQDLIEREITFKTPIRIASFDDGLYLIDGFHRYIAYGRSGFDEIPAGQWELEECSSIDEVRLFAMAANVAHGKSNTQHDYRYIIESLMEADPKKYKANVFEPNLKAIYTALQCAKSVIHNANKRSFDGMPSLSHLCEERRNDAILKQHAEGKSARAIAKLFGIKNKDTVLEVIKDSSGVAKNGQRPKMAASTETTIIGTLPTSTPDETKIEDVDSTLSSRIESEMNKEEGQEEATAYSWEDYEWDDGLIDPDAPIPAPIDLTGLDYKPNKPRSQVKLTAEKLEHKTHPNFLAQVQDESKEKLDKLKMAMVTAGFSETEAAIYAGQVVQRQTLSIAGKQSREFLKINNGG